MEAFPAAAGGTSALLHCLSQLNDDVLTACLLPKIMEQGSAGSVALTCSQLRRLCQSSTQHLDLSMHRLVDNPANNPALAQQLIAAFPQCTSLKVSWHSSAIDLVHQHISTLLAGLPELHTITIKFDDATNKADLRPVVGQLRQHAAGLRCLRLQLDHAWEYDSTWAALEDIVNLTRLEVAFNTRVEFPCTQHDLQQLTGLTKLQSFTIKAPVAYWADPFGDAEPQPAAQQFPACLSSLTQLVLPLEVVRESDAFYGAIRQLKGLRCVGANCWAADALPVLQDLTQVTAVHGSWDMSAGGDVSKLICAHVKELGETKEPPFQAFSNLVCVSFSQLSYKSLGDVCCFCTALQKLALTDCTDADVWVEDEGAREAQCVSVLRALATMQHLTHLELSFQNDSGLIIFTVAAAAVRTPKLRCLHVHGHATPVALVQLQRLRGLVELTVHVSHKKATDPSGAFSAEAIYVLMVGLSAVPKLCLVFPRLMLPGMVAFARERAAQLQLPLPAVLQVCVAGEEGRIRF